MGKWKQVIIMEVEEAKDKSDTTPGGKYRRDTPWLIEAFQKQDVLVDTIFITYADTPESLMARFPNAAFLGRVNNMDYLSITFRQYLTLLSALESKGVLLGPFASDIKHFDSKMIVRDLCETALGIDGVKVHRYVDMTHTSISELDHILPADGPPRVLKTMSGSTGLAVWKLENKDANTVIVTDAYDQCSKDFPRAGVLKAFLNVCQDDAISMPFLPFIKDGELRFLLCKDKVLDVVHKKPMDKEGFTATLRSGAMYSILNLDEHKEMVIAVQAWCIDMKKTLNISEFPYWWSVDCIEAVGWHPGQIRGINPSRHLVLSETNYMCLGLVIDTSSEAKVKGMCFADMIVDNFLS